MDLIGTLRLVTTTLTPPRILALERERARNARRMISGNARVKRLAVVSSAQSHACSPF
jgi:hypothetical protein